MKPKLAGSIQLVIADDHHMFLDGLVGLLDGISDIDIIGRAANGEALLDLVANQEVDIALADVSMPGPGLVAIMDQIEAGGSACRVIALTMHLERSFALEMIDKGLAGYVTKDAVFSEVLEAIRSVAAVKIYLCRQIA